MITLAILMPLFNAKKYVREALGSIKRQEFSSLRDKRVLVHVFILDDASEDDSFKTAKEYIKANSLETTFHLSSHTKNIGPLKTRLELIAMCREFERENNIAFTHFFGLDSDDFILHTNALSRLLELSLNFNAPFSQGLFTREEELANKLCDKSIKKEALENVKIIKGEELASQYSFNGAIIKASIIYGYFDIMASYNIMPIYSFEDYLSSLVINALSGRYVQASFYIYYHRYNLASVGNRLSNNLSDAKHISIAEVYLMFCRLQNDARINSLPSFQAMIKKRLPHHRDLLSTLATTDELRRRNTLYTLRKRLDTGGLLGFIKYELAALPHRRTSELFHAFAMLRDRLRR